MAGKFDRANHPRGYARIALATIRLFNGTAALFAPTTLARRLGDTPEANPLPSTDSGCPVFARSSSALNYCCETANCAPTPSVLRLWSAPSTPSRS